MAKKSKKQRTSKGPRKVQVTASSVPDTLKKARARRRKQLREAGG